MDTADPRVTDVWFDNLEKGFWAAENLIILLFSTWSLTMQETSKKLAEKYPEMKIVGNAKTFPMMKQFFTIDGLDDRSVVVKRGTRFLLETTHFSS